MEKFFVDPDITQAETLPPIFYKSQEIFEKLKETVFLKTWQWIGDSASTVPLAETVHPFVMLPDFLNEPLLLVRDKESEVKCLSNVCTHRGNLVATKPGKAKGLTCMYHGRQFDLAGNFKHMPEFSQVKNFPRPCEGLREFSIKDLCGHLFVSLEPSFDFAEVLEKMNERIGHLPLESFKRNDVLSKEYIVNCHWALYCDNYLEGFHIPFVHADLNSVLDYGNYKTELYPHMNLQIGYTDGETEIFDLPEGHPDHGKEVAAYYYWVFPNMMFNFYPWGLSINIVKPLSLNKTKVSFITYVYDETKLDMGAGSLLDKVEMEDEFVVESVHQGLKSRFYPSGRFSPTKEQGVHHFHGLLAKYVND